MPKLPLLLLVIGCSSPREDSSQSPGSPDAPPALYGLQGSEGALLWVEAAAEGSWILERDLAGGWEELAEGSGPWFDPDALANTLYRLSDPASGEAGDSLVPSAMALELAAARRGLIYLADEEAALDWTVDLPDLSEFPPATGLLLQLEEKDETWFLDPSCLEKGDTSSCWTSDFASLQELESVSASQSMSFAAETDSPGQVELSVRLAALLDGEQPTTVGQASISLLLLGRKLAFGDLHAHCNLSMDGCEDRDADCADREESAGVAFFAEAMANGLDFAALTDHAEYVTYHPDGSPLSAGTDIWDEQDRLVQEAEGVDGFVPILGYEWTFDNKTGNGTFDGGHKTVIFDGTDICSDYRVAAPTISDAFNKNRNGELYVGPNPVLAEDVPSFWERLDEAADSCGEERLISFFHHTALSTPQPVDWAAEHNAPDERYETLVEIYSEHGASECADTEAEHCGWGLPEDSTYLGEEGSLQAALALGHRLGVIAGTDSHDSRPGSLGDGPSCTSYWRDEDGDGQDELNCLHYGGGLAGALYEAELTRESLFDALFARNTLATSGPMVSVRAAVLDSAGNVSLPGGTVDAEAGPHQVIVSVEESLDAATLLSIHLLDQDGATLAESLDELLEENLSLSSGDAVYARIRLQPEGVDDEARIWTSPFYAE